MLYYAVTIVKPVLFRENLREGENQVEFNHKKITALAANENISLFSVLQLNKTSEMKKNDS